MRGLTRDWWMGTLPAPLDWTLRFPEALFRRAVLQRNRRFDRQATAGRGVLSVPAISVGNLTVGGTGKTPVAAWIAKGLRASGHRPALLLSGYGPDEASLHRRWNPDISVLADRDRVRAAERAVGTGADLVILDDGFQHRRLPRSFDLVLLSAETGFPPKLLPRGPYREGLDALVRADHLLLTRRSAASEAVERISSQLRHCVPELPLAVLRFAPDRWTDLSGATSSAPDAARVLAVSSVARPDGFHALVAESLPTAIARFLPFPDHHAFGLRDITRIRKAAGTDAWIVTTEKDAVKLERFAEMLPPTRVLGLALRFEAGEDNLVAALQSAARKVP